MYSQIISIEEGIIHSTIDEQRWKADLPIDFTDEGIFSIESDLHPKKALWSIISKEEGVSNIISLILPQLQNAYSPIILTEEGIFNFFKPVLLKALSPIFSKEECASNINSFKQ